MAEMYKQVTEDPPAREPGALEADANPPVAPEVGARASSGAASPRAKGKAKGIVLLGIWLALLAGLIVGINLMNQPPVIKPGIVKPPANPMPNLSALRLETDWPKIMALAAAPPRGKAEARYTLAEFGDFQCPQCGNARPVLEKMLAQYPDQVNLIFVHRPIPSIHEWALPSGQASEIAAAAGKFWPMYDVLYAHQDDLEPGYYGDYATKAGLDKAEFQKAFDAGQGKDRLKAAAKLANDEDIDETPTILVHDSVAKTVTIYVGMITAKNAESGVPYPGLDKLTAAPPWAK